MRNLGQKTWLYAGQPDKRQSDARYLLLPKALHEDSEHFAHQRRVVGKAVAEREGQREHPLPHGDLGQRATGEMRGGVGHLATASRRTEAAGKDSAVQEPAKLTHDEAGHRSLASGLRRA